MAQCKHCGKKGLFLKVNQGGICKDCERILSLQAEEQQLQQKLQSLNNTLSDRQKLYNQIFDTATSNALKSVNDEIETKKRAISEMSSFINSKTNQLSILDENLAKTNKEITSAARKAQRIKSLYKAMEHSIAGFSDKNAELTGFLVPYAVNNMDCELEPVIKLKLHCMDIRELRSLYNQNFKQIESTLEKYQNRYTTKTNMTIYKLMVIALKAELQNVLFNIKFGKLDNAVENIKSITAKYLTISTEGNQSIAPTIAKFIGEIEYFFIEAVKIEYEYYVKKERIKEEQRALREQMRQEAEERKQLEIQRKQVEKEEIKYKNEMSSVEEQLKNAVENEKIVQLQERLAQLQIQLNAVEEKKDEIIHLQNGKAGYVYVISNLGSFGDHVFKVGMTRRLEPQDRVNELGDASVPFPFDVHCFIFSDDAVSLEQNMHKALHDKRVNKINIRKEFFNVSIDDLESLVYSLQPSSEFCKTMLAEQYTQSLSVDEIPEEISLDDDLDENFDADFDTDID